MKIIIFPLLLLGCLFSCKIDESLTVSNNPLTKSTCVSKSTGAFLVGKNDVLEIIDSLYSSKNTNIWISSSIVNSNDTLCFSRIREIFSPNYSSWIFIVDMNPLANWGHECLYYYVNAMTGEIETVTQTILPGRIELDVVKSYNTGNSTRETLYDISKIKSRSIAGKHSSRSNNKWAVIINGGYNRYANYTRYWNDCQAIYTTLTSVYGYSKEKIFVLISDGTNPAIDQNNDTSSPIDLDGDGATDIDYSATKSNITTVFNTIGSQVTAGDDVFIYVIDHGSLLPSNQSAICLWNEDVISQSEFASEVNKITTGAHVHIVLGQCNSGGFVSSFTNRANTTITTACSASESSYSLSNSSYDEFVYQWTAAVLGEDPYGVTVDADYDNDGNVSILEAFKYANANDAFVTGVTINGIFCKETPQFNSNVNTFGYNHGLLGKLFELASISGSINLSTSGRNKYEINNLPNSASVQWQYSNLLTNYSSTNTYIWITSLLSDRIYVNQYVNALITIPLLSFQYSISKYGKAEYPKQTI